MKPILHTNQLVGQLDGKTQRLVFDVRITGNATPASKVQTSDLPGVVFLATEGKDDVTAVETISFTTAADATNAQFGILVKGSEISGSGSIKGVKKVEVSQVVATGTAITVAGVSSSHLSSGGNIVIDILATGTSLTNENPVFCIDITYELA